MEKATQILTPHASPRQTGNARVTASPAAGRILINDSAVLRHGLGEATLPPLLSTSFCFFDCYLIWGMTALLCWKPEEPLLGFYSPAHLDSGRIWQRQNELREDTVSCHQWQFVLDQCFSHFVMCVNLLGILLKCMLLIQEVWLGPEYLHL